MQHGFFETVLSGVILCISGMLGVYAYQSYHNEDSATYELYAEFSQVDGIVVGSDVRIGGIKVGSVVDLFINQDNFQATAKLNIDNKIKIPLNAVASVHSSGILGKGYIDIKASLAKDNTVYLQSTDVIKETRDSLALEDLLGRAIFLLSEQK